MKSLLSLSIILLAGIGSALGDNNLISPASQTVSVGQTFTVDINVDQIPDLFDYQFRDPAVLAAHSVTEKARSQTRVTPSIRPAPLITLPAPY